MQITVTAVKELREITGAGVMDCRGALLEAAGDMNEATRILRQRGIAISEKKASRAATQGLIEAYVHHGGHIGAMVEVNCETDFVARTEEFKELAHNLAMQVTATSPQFLSEEDIPEGTTSNPQEDCLLLQPFIKEPDKTVHDIILETTAKVGENIKVSRFIRFELGL